MDRKAQEEANGSAIRDDGRGPPRQSRSDPGSPRNRASDFVGWFSGVAITKRAAGWAGQAVNTPR